MAKVLRIDKRLPDTWQAALRDFFAWKQAQGVGARTLSDYQEHVTRFFTRFPDAEAWRLILRHVQRARQPR